MERLVYRSTSITHLQAELRHQELLADARRRALRHTAFGPRLGFRLPLPNLGLRDRRGG